MDMIGRSRFPQTRLVAPHSDGAITMRGKRIPPSVPVVARVEPAMRGEPSEDGSLMFFVFCGRCGSAFPHLWRQLPAALDQLKDGIVHERSEHDLYIAFFDLQGWRIEDGVLRPTANHKAKRLRLQRLASSLPRESTRGIRRNLSNSAFSREFSRKRDPKPYGFPHSRPVPELGVCARCNVTNRLVEVILAAQCGVG